MLQLNDYLQRIGYRDIPRVDIDTLKGIHRHHLLSIPYENLDVQLGTPLDLDLNRIFNKLVHNQRGGWCYEMNGLLGWALTEIGFDVRRVNGGVNRPERGDDAFGNHVVLLVTLDNVTWVVDAGFGDGFIDPIPLDHGPFEQRGFQFQLEKLEDGYWRMTNHEHGGAPSFDFGEEVADEQLFESQCQYLQTSPESPFVMVLIAQRFTDTGYEIQVGKLAKRITNQGVEITELDSADALVERLDQVFNLRADGVHDLWPQICERHELYFNNNE